MLAYATHIFLLSGKKPKGASPAYILYETFNFVNAWGKNNKSEKDSTVRNVLTFGCELQDSKK